MIPYIWYPLFKGSHTFKTACGFQVASGGYADDLDICPNCYRDIRYITSN